MKKLLEIKNLSAYFSSIKVLEDINFEIFENEIVAIIGESGSGKTVMVQSFVKLITDISLQGKILFKNQNLLNLSYKELLNYRGKEIAYIFQNSMSSLNPS